MNSPLFFLLSRSLANAVVVRVKRLRQPKYFAGALFGAAYFYFYFYRLMYLRGAGRPEGTSPLQLGLTPATTLNLAALGLFAVLILLAWVLPASRAALVFTEAEMAWLLPAPFTRSQLISYKLLKSQLGLLVMAVLLTFLTGRFGAAWTRALGWWIVFVTIQLHRLGASFVLTRLIDRGLSNTRRRFAVIALAGGLVALLVMWRQRAPEAPDLSALLTQGALGPWLHDLVVAGPAPWLLAPFRLVVQPWFAHDGREFLVALGPALAVMATHYLWVIRSDVAFEEASIMLSEKRAARIAAWRSGDKRVFLRARGVGTPIFRLRSTGSAVPAFVWKAWIRAGGRRSLCVGGAVSLVLIALASVPAVTGHAKPLGFGCGLLGFVTICVLLFAGPQETAQAVRGELQVADILKTVPVRGWQVVLGQLIGPSIRCAAIQWIGLLLMMIGGFAFTAVPPRISVLPVVASAALLLPPFNVVASLVPTGAMLLFPGWFKPGEMRGIEGSGMVLLMAFMQIAFLGLAMVFPALGATGILFLVQLIAPGAAAIIAGALTGAALLALESWRGALVLGGVFERFDASEQN